MYINGPITQAIAVLIFLLQIALVSWLALYVTARYVKKAVHLKTKLEKLMQSKYHDIGVGLSAFAVMGSLFFSEIANFPPCKLCWLQRIFIYPILLLFFVDLKKRSTQTWRYVLALAIPGWLIALYHYGIQMNLSLQKFSETVVPCGTVGMTPSCTSYYFAQFGYITIPMMSLTFLTTMIILALFIRKTQLKSTHQAN